MNTRIFTAGFDIGALATVVVWANGYLPTTATLVILIPTIYYLILLGEKVGGYIKILRDKFSK